MTTNEHRKGVTSHRQSAERLFETGMRQYHARNVQDALATLTLALAVDPHHVDAYRYRAYAHHDSHRFEEALRDITESIRLGNDDPKDHATKALVCIMLGRDHEAMDAVNAAIAQDSPNPMAYNLRALIHALMGKSEIAESDLRRGLSGLLPADTLRSYTRAELLSFVIDFLRSRKGDYLAPIAIRTYSAILRA